MGSRKEYHIKVSDGGGRPARIDRKTDMELEVVRTLLEELSEHPAFHTFTVTLTES